MKFLGPHACEEALERGEVQTLRIAPSAWERCARLRAAARERGVVVHREPMDSLDRRAQGQRHQGVLGEGADLALSGMDELAERIRAKGPGALVLALDGVTDPHNFGAILRSAAGAGADGIIFPERRSAQVNETVVRASAGTAGRVPLVRVVNLSRALDELKEAGAWVYGLAAGEGSRDYLEEPFDRPTVLVLGSEGEGLHQKIRERCDGLLRIPMPGGIESLNVSAAAAVMLFRVLARRKSGGA
ncbi:23S rRNA (guanosine(2251)-2'-O)-methyltransferase RlmB [Mesoterricola sediminis]|uniref:23S rRNA (Guanosine(2251)-2'-O)-methyltransferase RlmB n=1 Tax=Mesoterricola sediminis TaxID=2927980 RepID=A0AA48KAP4_9BACT|nr:23S rRNA (guanosine(2251)-2'-O)-methyltransferase RlmB [Mesoterricola sediminis]BDU75274.1 23S rRNA (guanosine(2251)-2'-O)-methyltransferase RlmB [Mesoterricola sediminis]